MTPRPAPQALRVVGWLLTPLVVWAASFSGAWLGATLGRRLEWMLLGGVLGGATGLALWVHRLRKSRISMSNVEDRSPK